MMELHAAAKQFYNLTLADPEVIIRPPSAEKRDAITQAGERLRAALVAASPCAAQPIQAHSKSEYKRLTTLGADVVPPAAAQGGQQPDLPEDGFVWMTHPSRFDGKPFPVWTYIDHGTRFYVPFDERACEFAWSDRGKSWQVVAAPVPAAPLTEERIDAIVHDQDDGEWFVHQITKLEWRQFARDIESACAAKWGITLAGTAQKGGE